MPLTPFCPVPALSHFSIHNLPYGIFSRAGEPRRVGVALGEFVIDLAALSRTGLFRGRHLRSATCFDQVPDVRSQY